jgi:hypothetical protein
MPGGGDSSPKGSERKKRAVVAEPDGNGNPEANAGSASSPKKKQSKSKRDKKRAAEEDDELELLNVPPAEAPPPEPVEQVTPKPNRVSIAVPSSRSSEDKLTLGYLVRLNIIVPTLFLAVAVTLIALLGVHIDQMVKRAAHERHGQYVTAIAEASIDIALEAHQQKLTIAAGTDYPLTNNLRGRILRRLSAVKDELPRGVAEPRGLSLARQQVIDPNIVSSITILNTLATCFGELLPESTTRPKLANTLQMSVHWMAALRLTSVLGPLSATPFDALSSIDALKFSAGTAALFQVGFPYNSLPPASIVSAPGQTVGLSPNSNLRNLLDRVDTAAAERISIPLAIPNSTFAVDSETIRLLEAAKRFITTRRNSLLNNGSVQLMNRKLALLIVAILVLLIGTGVSIALIAEQHSFLQQKLVLKKDFTQTSSSNVMVKKATLKTIDAISQRLAVMSLTVPQSSNPLQIELRLQCAVKPLQMLRPFVPTFAFATKPELEVLLDENGQEYYSESIPKLNLEVGLKRRLSSCVMLIDFSLLNLWATEAAESDSQEEQEKYIRRVSRFNNWYVGVQKLAQYFGGFVLQTSHHGMLVEFRRSEIADLNTSMKTLKSEEDEAPSGTAPGSGTGIGSADLANLGDGEADGDEVQEAEALAIRCAFGVRESVEALDQADAEAQHSVSHQSADTDIGSRSRVSIAVASNLTIEGILQTHVSKHYCVIGNLIETLNRLRAASSRYHTDIIIDQPTNQVLSKADFLTRPLDHVDGVGVIYSVLLERPAIDVPDRELVLKEQKKMDERVTHWELTFGKYLEARDAQTAEKYEEAYRSLEIYRQLYISPEEDDPAYMAVRANLQKILNDMGITVTMDEEDWQGQVTSSGSGVAPPASSTSSNPPAATGLLQPPSPTYMTARR